MMLKIKGPNEREISSYVVNKLWKVPEIERTLTFFSFRESKNTHKLKLK